MMRRLILLAHGSRDPRWREPFYGLVERVSQSFRESDPVYASASVDLAFMEMSPPTLLERAGAAVEDGIQELHVLPLFMAAGDHVRSDIPVQVNEVQARYPQLAVTLHPPVGEHPLLVNALVEIAVSTLPGLPASP